MGPYGNCPSEKSLIDYAGDSLSADESAVVLEHLNQCQICANAVDWIRCHLLRPHEDDKEDLTGIGIPGEEDELPRESDLNPSTPQPVLEFDYASLARTLYAGSHGRLGKYEILSELGIGGMGIVFKGWDDRLQRHVAIKVLRRPLAAQSASRLRFFHEARRAARLTHPNIVTIHEMGEHHGIPYLVMELISGPTLQQRLRSETRLDLLTVLQISTQLARGLAAAHAHGIIHRDVKPGNILCDANSERVWITDFGLAHSENVGLDQSGTHWLAGTPAYMSPEQIAGEPLDARCDLYGLGCVLYEMVAGRSPLRGRSPLEMTVGVESGTPPPLSDVRPEVPTFFSDLVSRLLQKAPADRFQSAAEVAALLTRQRNRLEAECAECDSNSPPPSGSALTRSTQGWAVSTTLPPSAFHSVRPLHRMATWISTFWHRFPRGPSPFGAVPGAPNSSDSFNDTPLTATTGVSRSPFVAVNRSGLGDCRTLAEALHRVAPGGTIEIQEDLILTEPVSLCDRLLSGITLHAPLGAIVSYPGGDTLFQIDGASRVAVVGLGFDLAEKQTAVTISGQCPGLRLEQLSVRQPRGAASGAIVFRAGATGSSNAPLKISQCDFQAPRSVVLEGAPEAHTAHLRIEQNLFRGSGMDANSIGIHVASRGEDVIIRDNDFCFQNQAIVIELSENGHPDPLGIQANRFLACHEWLCVAGEYQSLPRWSIIDNRIARTRTVGLCRSQLENGAASWFQNNQWLVGARESLLDPQSASRVATVTVESLRLGWGRDPSPSDAGVR